MNSADLRVWNDKDGFFIVKINHPHSFVFCRMRRQFVPMMEAAEPTFLYPSHAEAQAEMEALNA